VILGVSFDGRAANAAFAEKFHFNFPLLCDTDRKLGVAYGAADDASAAMARRAGVIIDPQGKILEYHAKVAPKDFPDQALAAIPDAAGAVRG
jgi:peroxiredoxin Q/BCP